MVMRGECWGVADTGGHRRASACEGGHGCRRYSRQASQLPEQHIDAGRHGRRLSSLWLAPTCITLRPQHHLAVGD